VAILGVLAAVVIPNVVGVMARGGKEAYETDAEAIQLAASTFYSDIHGGFVPATGHWDDNTYPPVSDHYYPTSLGVFSAHYLALGAAGGDTRNPNNKLIVNGSGTAATDAQIQASAIWMGLLINAPGQIAATAGGTAERGNNVSVLGNDTGLYLQRMSKSAMATNNYNGAPSGGGGSYAWVVGKNGNVYGAYRLAGDTWYNGFSGSYP
jgi:type II secretory pathway pseudopilin PulG